jgi:flagellar biosynthesis protein FlhG
MKRRSTVVAIVSGKGGVGKSVTAVNLAETLAVMGERVALLDADFGQGACGILLNESPPASVLDLALGRVELDDVLHPTRSGFTLVQAVAEPGQADGHHEALYRTLDWLLKELRHTHTFVLIDAPAGTEGPVRWALDRAQLGLMVIVGEPTAIADAYRLCKLLWQRAPHYPLGCVVNFADTEAEARSVADRFAELTHHFLHHRPMYLGWVPFSAQVRQSVHRQQPAVQSPGPVRNAFQRLAEALVRGAIEQPASCPTS